MADIAGAAVLIWDTDGGMDSFRIPRGTAQALLSAESGRRACAPDPARQALLSLADEFDRRAGNCAVSAEACRAEGADIAEAVLEAVQTAFWQAAQVARRAAEEAADPSRHGGASRDMASARRSAPPGAANEAGPVSPDAGNVSVAYSAAKEGA